MHFDFAHPLWGTFLCSWLHNSKKSNLTDILVILPSYSIWPNFITIGKVEDIFLAYAYVLHQSLPEKFFKKIHYRQITELGHMKQKNIHTEFPEKEL